MNKYLVSVGLVACLVLSAISSVSMADEVNVYSARKEKLIKPLLDSFTKETGITVNLVTGKADMLLKRLETEGKNSPADLFITTDAGRLYRAKQAGVLQTIDSKAINNIVPANLRDSENQWFSLSLRARPIFYVTESVNPQELSSYEDLADEKWNKKICIRSSNNIYNQSLVASMLATNGPEATLEWAKKFVNNLAIPPRGGDRDQIKAAAAGVCDLAIANTYYLGKMLTAKDGQKEAAAKVKIFWPNQSDRGTHINVSGAGVTAHAKNKDNAVKLLEHLLTKDSQKWYSQVNHEYPVRADVEWSPMLKGWGEFKSDEINMSMLGEFNHEAVKIMDLAGWK